MPKTLIDVNTKPQRQEEGILNVSELFTDTLQGEGIYIGHPATFLRLQGCPVGCVWCDTAQIWNKGHFYSQEEIFLLLEENGIIEKLRTGEQHLVITGGSPLMQQTRLLVLLSSFIDRYGFKPFIEVENECSMVPLKSLVEYVDCWNNSPKLENSGVNKTKRYNPSVLSYMNLLSNSWFKFVVSKESEWEEIHRDFIQSRIVDMDRIILMPQGATKSELEKTRVLVAEMAMKYGVRFSDRLQVTLYSDRQSV